MKNDNDEEYLESLLNSVINDKEIDNQNDEIDWIDEELNDNSDDIDFDSYMNAQSNKKGNVKSVKEKSSYVKKEPDEPDNQKLQHIDKKEHMNIDQDDHKKAEKSINTPALENQDENNMLDPVINDNGLDVNDIDITGENASDIDDIIKNMNTYDSELSDFDHKKKEKKLKEKEAKQKKKQEKQKIKEEKQKQKEEKQRKQETLKSSSKINSVSTNSKSIDLDINALENDHLTDAIEDINLDNDDLYTSKELMDGDTKPSKARHGKKEDIFEEIPNENKKESFFKRLFKKKKSDENSNIESDDILDETGSVLDDMEKLSMSDLDLDEKDLFGEHDKEFSDENEDSDVKGKKKKKEKKEKVKKIKEKKVKVKKEKKPVSKKDLIKISPLACILITTIIIGSIVALMIFSSSRHYNDNIKKATSYYVDQKYSDAYNLLAGMDIKAKDKNFYKQVENIMKVQKHENDFNNYIKLKKYPEALESLLRGIKSFDKNINASASLGTSDIQNNNLATINSQLQSYFGMTENDARSILQIQDKKEYTKAICEKAANINLTEEGNN